MNNVSTKESGNLQRSHSSGSSSLLKFSLVHEPPDRWTPCITLVNGKSELLISLREIHLESNKGGDMYSLTIYKGSIDNDMKNLKAFPCDMDGLTLEM